MATKSKGTAKRDTLVDNEEKIQEIWENAKAFESKVDEKKEKFMVTFPYPYSNGNLHLGHAYSVTKAVFRAQYERHLGKSVLFPFGFHCTGMPIQAAAKKLQMEIGQFGCPPSFPENNKDSTAAAGTSDIVKKVEKKNPEKKAKGGKTKLVAKTGTGIVRQWNILKMMVPEEDIPAFVDPVHWLHYFPPLGVKHMHRLGAGVDWRRSFITTETNPYYDSFIQWQFNTLKEKNDKILFGKRNSVYSLLDGQVCMDHDRSEGEGSCPQEYVLIKLQVLSQPLQARHTKMSALLSAHPGKVFLVPATLRPETMYGQTNCFMLPTGNYGAFYVSSLDQVFIMSARSARGLSCQLVKNNPDTYYTEEFAKIEQLESFTGDELLGLPLNAPLASYPIVYTLPLLTISMNKGTGVVTSVPSDAPDDYIALKNLQDKPEFAAKYNITPEMVMPFQVVPIIEIPGYGNASAEFMCKKLKISSFNDTSKLAQAKDETYLKGFTSGIMTVGKYNSYKVSDAKLLIKQDLIDAGLACLYHEPESRVVSRTGDECVVAACDQWYLAYGEEKWRDKVYEHVSNPDKFNAYDSVALTKYQRTIHWLKEWACTRLFGLGTYLPWDKKWLIESLSDSTIYMAYYTIAHYLQGADNLEGSQPNPQYNITPDQMTHEVWNYIFQKHAPFPVNTTISKDTLDSMRQEFHYWYPMDLRVSAKDLIPNHLTMALYNHAAIWDQYPELWPKGYYTNGHVLVDAEKMSKSKGNFLMMEETIYEYSADATRFACADAGDSLDDANFSRETADMAILALTTESTWIAEAISSLPTLRNDACDKLYFMDTVFQNETNRLIQQTSECFEGQQFREGLKKCWFEMMQVRNEYRSWCDDSSIPMHKDIILHWIKSLIVMICPICPHWSEILWQQHIDLLAGNKGLVVHAPWPNQTSVEDKLLSRQASFLRDAVKNCRQQSIKQSSPKKPNTKILVTNSYPTWKINTLHFMHEQFNSETNKFPSDFMKQLKTWSATNVTDKKMIKFTMQFASWMKREVEEVGPMAMDINVPYNQFDILQNNLKYISAQINKENVEVYELSDGNNADIPDKVLENVSPGRPYLWLH